MSTEFCPYKGLDPYTEHDRRYFFGRRQDTAIVAANLLASRIIVFYGPTGVGKSSVLGAGVIPYIRRKPDYNVATFRDWQGTSFLGTLKQLVIDALRDDQRIIGPQPPSTLRLDHLLADAAATSGRTFALILDQFEEYFVYHSGRSTGEQFEEELARAINRPDTHTNVLFAIREDSLALLDRLQGRIPGLMGNCLRVAHLDRAAAIEAIKGPLAEYNTEFHPDGPPEQRVFIEDGGEPAHGEGAVVGALLEDVQAGRVTLGRTGQGERLDDPAAVERQGQPVRVETAFLQMVLTRLWDEDITANNRGLRLETYERLGRADTIVRNYLDEVMWNLRPDYREVCARFFDRLVAPSGTKFACRLDWLQRWAGDLADRVPDVLEILVKNRIIRPVAGGATENLPYYVIAHDVLAAAVLDWTARYTEERDRAAKERDRAARDKQRRARVLTAVLVGAVIGLVITLGSVALALMRSREAGKATAALAASLTERGDFLAEQRRLSAQREQEEITLRRLAISARLAAAVAEVADRDLRLGNLLALHSVAESRAAGNGQATDESRQALYRAVAAARPGAVLKRPAHEAALRSAAFNREGTRLATSSYDMTAKIWDTDSGTELLWLTGHKDYLFLIAFTRDGRRIATASSDHTARLWDAWSGSPLRTFEHPEGAMGVGFSPSGRLLATSGRDGVRIWEAASDAPSRLCCQHTDGVRAVSFVSDQRLVTSGRDGLAKLWDLASGAEVVAFKGHSDKIVTDIAVSPDGKRVATSSYDKTARIWDIDSGREILKLEGHTDSVIAVGFSPDGKLLATASNDRTAKVWETTSGKVVSTLSGHGGGVWGVLFHPDGKRIATASVDKTARVWDAKTGQELLNISTVLAGTDLVSFSRSSTRMVTGGGQDAQTWDIASGRLIAAFRNRSRESEESLTAVAMNRLGSRVGTGGKEGTVRIVDGVSGSEIRVFNEHKGAIVGMAFSPDGHQLATSGVDRSVRLWDTESPEVAKVFVQHAKPVGDLRFNRDGTRLAIAVDDSAVEVWDVKRASIVKAFRGHGGRVTAVAFSPDGSHLVTASADRTARVWDGASGKALTLAGHADVVNHVVFSADGKSVATAGQDRTARIWDAMTGQERLTFTLTAPVIGVVFSPDGKSLITYDKSGTLRDFLLTFEDVDTAARRFAGDRELTGAECMRYFLTPSCPTLP